MSPEERVKEMMKMGKEAKHQVDSYLTQLHSTTMDNLSRLSKIRAEAKKTMNKG